MINIIYKSRINIRLTIRKIDYFYNYKNRLFLESKE